MREPETNKLLIYAIVKKCFLYEWNKIIKHAISSSIWNHPKRVDEWEIVEIKLFIFLWGKVISVSLGSIQKNKNCWTKWKQCVFCFRQEFFYRWSKQYMRCWGFWYRKPIFVFHKSERVFETNCISYSLPKTIAFD